MVPQLEAIAHVRSLLRPEYHLPLIEDVEQFKRRFAAHVGAGRQPTVTTALDPEGFRFSVSALYKEHPYEVDEAVRVSADDEFEVFFNLALTGTCIAEKRRDLDYEAI